MVGKGAPLPLRIRLAHHNHDGKLLSLLGVLEPWRRGSRAQISKPPVSNPVFQSRICFVFFLIGWVARSIGGAVAEPILTAFGVK